MIFPFILLLILFLFLKKRNSKIPQKYGLFSNHITILTNAQMKEFILKDKDNFIKNLSKHDLQARNSSSNDDYLNKVLSSIPYNIKNSTKKKLKKTIQKADQLLSKEYKDIADIPWKIAIIKGKNYENGFPHTREDIIFLFDYIVDDFYPEEELIKVLIHEKIHVFQRNYRYHPIMLDYMKPFKRYKTKEDLKQIEPLIRSNPDLDDYVYQDENGKIYMTGIFNPNPNNLTDIKGSNEEEHPFEKMAYTISNNLILKNKSF
jgi:hypothetical protein